MKYQLIKGDNVLTEELDKFFEATQNIGSKSKAITKTMYGINHSNIPTFTESSKDSKGYVFITRPQLNLRTGNIRNVRMFYDMLTTNKKSMFSYVRGMLDPRTEEMSLLIDNGNPFIPIVTNNISALTGWPDSVLPIYTSPEGNKKQQFSIADGSVDIYNSFDLNLTMKNVVGDPLLYMFQVWERYISEVFEGTLYPYEDFITQNEIDYNTRIYRIVMDRDNKYVKRIYATGASIPISVPNGGLADYTKETVYSGNTKEITIAFKCDGMISNDPILIHTFNETVNIFSPGIENMTKIPNDVKHLNNFRGIPYINPDTMELEWYI